ncbi:hypothetical protein GY21_10885 [Cryobacterium roopkundense]|uniref:Uncharacterized protein n=1 Tax=Cryobacterium roopkundense TaxID=1001240 RepID=A0A099J5B6_9MICO|nr:hypothetical protein [Cryobacterium roopkundense]KGJ73536.1 hypothetical protein GY21_10885 [Cryobacterium roopkundense]MBB5641450.1 hypothetical protein [Cryobacterium roopkundense]
MTQTRDRLSSCADVDTRGREIGVTELSRTQWRVCDRTIAAGDPRAIFGFIERFDDSFEVSNFRLSERSVFSTFERAVASLATPMIRKALS